MGWLSRLAGRRDSRTTISASGREMVILCSTRAKKVLARRDRPLVAELELAFACIACKQVRFHDAPVDGDVIEVNEKLGLLITAIVPTTCATGSTRTAANVAVRSFIPKWVRIDYAKRGWVGEYGL